MGSKLFSPFSLRGLTLRNRIVVSPMCQYCAGNDGKPHDWHLMHYGNLAVSGFGLILSEAIAVEPRGRITPNCLHLESDENERALERIIGFCRTWGSGSLGIQLHHAGRKASAGSVTWEANVKRSLLPEEGAWPTVAASPIPMAPDSQVPEALDKAGIASVIDAFVATTQRAESLGFDVAEIHGAHGYLIHSFLSPITNQRGDAYGGSLANRMRFPLDVFSAVRDAWPVDKPLGIRISATDHLKGGWDLADSIAFARELKVLGCDFIDVSSGGLSPEERYSVGPGYQVSYSTEIRKEVGIPTMTVGMIVEPHHAEGIVANGQADMIALGREALFNPRWPWHAAEQLGADITYPQQYLRSDPSLRPEAFAENRDTNATAP